MKIKIAFEILYLSILLIGTSVKAQTNTNDGTEAGNAGTNNSSFGYYAGDIITGTNNCFIGYYSGKSATSANENSFLGSSSGKFLTTGLRNTYVGFYSGYSTTTGVSNVMLGWKAGFSNQTTNSNVFVGTEAGFSSTASYNVFIGTQAGRLNTGASNVFIGYQSGYNETGSNKLIISNSNTQTPLIYGEFNTGKIGINSGTPVGKFQLGNQYRVFLDDNICTESTGWRTNMIGFNAVRRSDGLWETYGDGSFNGGAVIASDAQGGFHFYSFNSTGTVTTTHM